MSRTYFSDQWFVLLIRFSIPIDVEINSSTIYTYSKIFSSKYGLCFSWSYKAKFTWIQKESGSL